MKLKKTIASLALLVILSGCAGNNSTEKDTGKVTGAPVTDVNNSGMFPETSGNGNNSGMTTENNPFSYTAEDVFRLLKKAGDETNFTMAYSIMTEEGKVTYENVYTSKYIYFDYAKAGYMSVKDYAGENLLYNFDQKDGEFVLENALAYDDESGKRVAIRSTEEMNPLHGALAGKEATVFEQRQRAFYTEDKTIITALCYLRGVTNLVNEIMGVEIEVDNEFDELINFAFAPNFKTTEGAAKVDAIGVCSLHFIGTSSVDEVEAFQSSYSLPTDKLPSTVKEGLNGKVSLSATNILHYKTDDLYEKYDIVSEEDRMQYSRYVNGVTSPTTTYLTKGADGKAKQVYVDYQNKVVEKTLEDDFSKVAIAPKDALEFDAFLKTGDDTYTYYGYNGRWMINNLTKIDMGEILSLTLKTTEGKISSLKAISTTRMDSYTQSMYFELNVDFTSTYDFTKPSAHESNYRVSAILNQLYSNDFDLNIPFSAKISTVGSSAYPVYVSVFSSKGDKDIDTILYTQDYIDPAPGAYEEVLTKRWGYFKSGEDLIPYSVRDDNTTVSTSLNIANTRLNKMLGMDLSGNCFKKTGVTEGANTVYSLYSDVDDIANHVLGGSNKKNIIPSSLKFTANGYTPVKLEYEFNGLDLFKGKEQVEFSNWNSATKPAEIDYTTLKPFVEPDNWQDGAPEVYPTMKAVLGDCIKDVPFLYNKEMAGNWGVDSNVDYKWVVVFNDTYAASEDKDDLSFQYMKDYEALLRKNGFTDCPYPMDGKPGLVKDELHVRVGDRGMGGIRFMYGDDLDPFGPKDSSK